MPFLPERITARQTVASETWISDRQFLENYQNGFATLNNQQDLLLMIKF